MIWEVAVLSDFVLCSSLCGFGRTVNSGVYTNTYIGTIVLHIQDKHQRCVAPATENRILGTAAPVQICISAKNTPPADA
ncbi:hypothetical protein PI124_g1553 [Phytophthora idaei]|nr:hypothetical protein PI124_g1553 [Phytophthora idaei]